jgi:hypothetical protein
VSFIPLRCHPLRCNESCRRRRLNIWNKLKRPSSAVDVGACGADVPSAPPLSGGEATTFFTAFYLRALWLVAVRALLPTQLARQAAGRQRIAQHRGTPTRTLCFRAVELQTGSVPCPATETPACSLRIWRTQGWLGRGPGWHVSLSLICSGHAGCFASPGVCMPAAPGLLPSLGLLALAPCKLCADARCLALRARCPGGGVRLCWLCRL